MSTLQQSLNQRRAAEAVVSSSVIAAAQSPALTIHLWHGETWILPWAQFVSARLSDGGRQLELAFTNCVATVIGENLEGLVDSLAGFRIGELRDLPASYRKQSAEGEPFVEQIKLSVIGQ
jgi:hypothetical protein